MSLSPRDARALKLLAATVPLFLIVLLMPTGRDSGPAVVGGGAMTIPLAEARLAKARAIVASIPARERSLADVKAHLAAREKGMIEAGTAAQAQAVLLQLLRRLTRAQSPPLEVSQIEPGMIQPLGKDYGVVLATMSLNCRIEQLVNLLADLSAQPELIATHELHVHAADPKQKTVGVRMVVSGVIPRRLVPERRGAAF
jgi:hypothetical protein